MINTLIRANYTRPIYDYVKSGQLDIKADGTAYSDLDYYLHNNILEYEVFTDNCDGKILLRGLNITEMIDASSTGLARPKLTIYVFDYCGISPTKDQQFKFSDDPDGKTTPLNIVKTIEVSTDDYLDIINGDYEATRAEIRFDEPVYIQNLQKDSTLKMIAVTRGTVPTFDSTAKFYIDVITQVI